MSILHRTAYLTLSTLLAIVPAACGGDDDDDDDDNPAIDASDGDDEPDAAVEEPDAAPVEPDAAVLEGSQFLLGLEIAALGTTAQFRVIATVALDGATADFGLQPITDPACVDKGEESGIPVGAQAIYADVAINKDFSFTLNVDDAVIPANAHAIPTCDGDLTVDLTVEGALTKDGTACGTVTLTFPIEGEGTFGTVAIKNGTVGDDLPEAVFACAK